MAYGQFWRASCKLIHWFIHALTHSFVNQSLLDTASGSGPGPPRKDGRKRGARVSLDQPSGAFPS